MNLNFGRFGLRWIFLVDFDLTLSRKYLQGCFQHFWFNLSNFLCALVTCRMARVSHVLYSKIVYSESGSYEFMSMRLILYILLELNFMAYRLFVLLGVNLVNSASNLAKVSCFRPSQACSHLYRIWFCDIHNQVCLHREFRGLNQRG